MATHSSPIDRLLAEPHRYGFMQAVRLLERWQVKAERLTSQEVLSRRLRFRNSLSMAFPPSEIAEFKPIALPLDARALAAHRPSGSAATFERIEITPAFMGLLGAGGALPAFYTELFAQREQLQRDHSARRFLDVFVHRAVVLFYQAWRKHRLPLRFEGDRQREALPQMLALAGFGQAALRRRLRSREGGVADEALAHYAGLLRQRPVSVAAIRQILGDYFQVPVRLDSFIGRWFTLPAEQQSVLGLGAGVLGAGAVLGERVWQRDLRLRLTLGPLRREAFARFLPGGPGHVALHELMTLMTGVSLEHEIRLTLRACDVQPARLAANDGPRLGWDGFLITRPAHEDRSDAGYDLHALA
ncbi:type VI secretion system baseplate subunit TssG [Aquincola sp. S2]|uniref:Type VI secretion system baseplate subunit TssG n=1 Tax=Pseudaquabacterium terrae TaxID=2732868 RepID=A0ABX2ELD7_9BURK|nr:type VI secretion system baseplate subunit TssG [Aquabacterium terrae]NRF69440.1 type VI secretion system baseplate subunit TssG [Aquabacterium terrae]